jgi:hypothetical protein
VVINSILQTRKGVALLPISTMHYN